MYWAVSGYDAAGGVITRRVEANDYAEAKSLAGFSEKRFIRARQTTMGGLVDELTRVRLKPLDQAMIVSQLGAAIASGQGADVAFRRVIGGHKALSKQIGRVEGYSRISDRLKQMGFIRQLVLMAQIGEESNTLGDSLMKAGDDLVLQTDLQSEVKKGLLPGLILSSIGIGILIVLPALIGPQLQEFFGTSGLTIQRNWATDIFFGLNEFVVGYWWVLLILLASGVALRRQLWAPIRGIPPFSLIEQYLRLLLGLRFISSFKPLYEGGIPTARALKNLLASAKGRDMRVYDRALEIVNKGRPLSEAIDQPEMPLTLRQGMSNFERVQDDMRPKILRVQSDLLLRQTRATARTISTALYVLGMLSAFATIFILVYGAYLPLLNAQSG